MKKIIFICGFFLSFIFVFASQRPPRLVDEANLLTSSQHEELEEMLDEISERQQCDVAIITVNSTNGKDIVAMADDIYDYEGYGMGPGDDGILFLIDMQYREWAISTYGFAIDAFTDLGQEWLMDEVTPYMSDGDFNQAFREFALLCDDYITSAKEGNIVGVYTPPSSGGDNHYYPTYPSSQKPQVTQKTSWVSLLLGSIGISMVIALVVMGMEVRKLKSVRIRTNASDYVKDPLYLTQSQDLYLYRNVTRRARPKETNNTSRGGSFHSSSSTHRSSSGRSHGGSRGSF